MSYWEYRPLSASSPPPRRPGRRAALSALLTLAVVVALAAGLRAAGFGRPPPPPAPTPTPLRSGPAALVTRGILARVGAVAPASLPTAATESYPYVDGPSLPAAHRVVAGVAQTETDAPHAGTNGGALALGPIAPGEPHLASSFDGLDAVQDLHVTGEDDHDAPDLALCASPDYVVEQLNLEMAVYRHDGTQAMSARSLLGFYDENPATVVADPRCVYDAASDTWFSTMLVIDTRSATSHVDLGVRPGADPTAAWSVYFLNTVDTLPGCPCWPDNERLAVDRYGVYITQNEFSLSSASTSPDATEAFEGAQVYAISKRALVALRPEVGYVRYGDLSLGGMLGDCLQPADDRTAAPAEYFVSSLYRGYQTSSGLGVWALADEERLDSGGVPTMSATFVPSGVYGFPPTPQQAGEGPPLSDNDARVQDLTYRAGVLWASLNTVVDAGGPANQAGVAWFAIAPTMQGDRLAGASLPDQGYVTARGASLVMGSLTVNVDGQGGIVAGLVGPDDDPSAAYATFSADGARRGFSALHVVASGIGPARNGGCLAQYGYICTWGDYSAATTDGADGDLWLATQYVPGPATPHENWGTRIWELQPAV